MKKILVTLLLIGYFAPLFATHIVGGSMTYEHLQGTEYLVKLEVLRDCFNGEPPFDDPAAIGLFDENNELLDFVLINLDATSNDTISLLAENSVCEYPPNICIHRTYYEQIIDIGNNGPVTLAYQRCCRSAVITNLIEPLDIGMTFFVTIDPAQENNSATFNKDIPLAVFVNTPFSYDASATDVDGDSLVYELSTPFRGPTPDNPLPQPPIAPPYPNVPFLLPNYSIDNMLGGDYPLEIDAQTGEMTAIPSTLGTFQIGYKINEFRDGELLNTIYREFTFVVTAPPMDLDFSVSGQVFVEEDMPLDKGFVKLIERDVTTDSLMVVEEQTLDVTGSYHFENIPPGVFYVKAYVDPTSIFYDQYLPTYFDSSAFWYDAESLNQCDTSQQFRDIYLLPAAEMFGEENIESIVTINFEGVPNLDLLLATEDGIFIQARTTDETGRFTFNNLLFGEYYVWVDLINSNIYNANPAVIDAPLDDGEYVGFLFDDYLQFDVVESDSEENIEHQIKWMQVFPNPSTGLVHFNLKTAITENMTVVVQDVFGAKVADFPIQSVSETFDLKHLPTGIYHFSLFENGEFIENARLLISE